RNVVGEVVSIIEVDAPSRGAEGRSIIHAEAYSAQVWSVTDRSKSVLSRSIRQRCNQHHRQVALTIPGTSLQRKPVARCRTDGIQGTVNGHTVAEDLTVTSRP